MHIPTKFTSGRPPIRFHVNDLSDSTISECGVHIGPNDTDEPHILGDARVYSRLLGHLDKYSNIETFLLADVPLFGLSVVRFKDATLCCFSTSHLLLDGVALGVFFKACTRLLSGEIERIPKVYSPAESPLQSLGANPAICHSLKQQQLSTLNFLLQYVLHNVKDFVGGTEQHIVVIPASFVQRLRKKAQIQGATSSVSEGDLVCAWWTRLVARLSMPSRTKTVVLYNLLAYHRTLTPDLLEKGKAYVGNACGYAATLLPARDVLHGKLLDVASRVRQSIATAQSRQEIEAYVALFRRAPGAVMPAFGDGTTYSIIMSNVLQANFLDNDFSGALETPPEQRDTRAGKPVWAHSFQPFCYPSFFSLIAKDSAGNMWLSGNMAKQRWDALREGWQNGQFDLDEQTGGNISSPGEARNIPSKL